MRSAAFKYHNVYQLEKSQLLELILVIKSIPWTEYAGSPQSVVVIEFDFFWVYSCVMKIPSRRLQAKMPRLN